MILSVQPQTVLAAPGDTDITEVNLNGVSNELWSNKDVTFATLDEESNYTIESQKWTSTVGNITPSSTGLKPTAGEEYTFIITLKAKDGYVFPIKSETAVFFDGALKVNGINCDSVVAMVTNDGKTLTATLFPLTKVKGVTDIPGGSGVTVETEVRDHYANISATGEIDITRESGYTVNPEGDAPNSSSTVWFKTDSDGKNLIETENQDEAVLSITINPDENKAVMALAGDIDKNISCTLNFNGTKYMGSKLTYNGSVEDKTTGKITIKETRDEYYAKFQLACTVNLIVKPVEEINEVVVKGAEFNYKAGNAPQKAAVPFFMDGVERCETAYECWEEMENGNPVAFWYSDESRYTSSMKRITQFEEGKKYMYSIELRAKDGYEFGDNCSVIINDTMNAPLNVHKTLNGLLITVVKTIAPVSQKEIGFVEINNAVLNFKDGDKPVFTGSVPDSAPYALTYEAWQTDGEGISSEEGFNDESHLPMWGGKLITTFDKSKTYTYRLCLKITDSGSKEGWFFGSNTKLKLNGQEVAFQRESSDDGQQFSGAAALTMVPEAAGTAPDYKITEGANGTWTQQSDGALRFVAHGDFSKFTGVKIDGILIATDKYTAVSGSTVITLKKDYLDTLSVGNHTLTVVYNDGECGTEFALMAAASHTHSYGSGWKYNEASHWHECTCGDEAETAAHSFQWVIDKEATAAGKGSKHEECSVCGYKKAAVEILAADPTAGSGNVTAPKTGDDSSPMAWLALLFISGGVLTGATVLGRKKKSL